MLLDAPAFLPEDFFAVDFVPADFLLAVFFALDARPAALFLVVLAPRPDMDRADADRPDTAAFFPVLFWQQWSSWQHCFWPWRPFSRHL